MEQTRAGIEPHAIASAADLTAGSFTDIVRELLHNSRRAGATRIDIYVNDWTDVEGPWAEDLARNAGAGPATSIVTVADDGHGVIDSSALLVYGRWCWGRALGEHPTGIGLFSAANSPVSITTRPAPGHGRRDGPWRATISPRHFRGEEPVSRFTDEQAPKPHGTAVSILADSVKLWALEELVRHFPVPVRVNGIDAPRNGLLDGAADTFEANGAIVGLFEGPPSRNPPGLFYWRGTTSPFHLHLGRGSLHARVDASRCPEVRLSRPGYHPLPNDPATREIREAIREQVRDRPDPSGRPAVR